MRRVNSPIAMQKLAIQWRKSGTEIGFVPTMGYLHEGHLSLVDRARQLVGPTGKVVVSIYVNPTQFSPTEDLTKYPRDLKKDLALCKAHGVDAVFVPRDEQMYPADPTAPASTLVRESMLSLRMEGNSRPTHFQGVTTVVAKLFNIVLPNFAVFGAKDYQQAAVIQRMTRDLQFGVKIKIAPTIRESDGLAMSSRNSYLSDSEREQATALWEALLSARRTVRKGRTAASKLVQELKKQIETRPAARVDYISIFNPDTLEELQYATKGAHIALAVFVGKTRLIDNSRL